MPPHPTLSKQSLSQFRELLNDQGNHLGDGIPDDEDSYLGEYVVSVSNEIPSGRPGAGGIYQIDEEQSDAKRSEFSINKLNE